MTGAGRSPGSRQTHVRLVSGGERTPWPPRQRFGSSGPNARASGPVPAQVVVAAVPPRTVTVVGEWFARTAVGRSPNPIVSPGDRQTGAVSTTGIGEAIIKVNLARDLVYRLKQGVSVGTAAEKAISHLEKSTASRAGLIALDHKGEVGTAYNTRDMQYALKKS